MDTIFIALRFWLANLLASPAPEDPVACLSLRELADIPAHHPAADRC